MIFFERIFFAVMEFCGGPNILRSAYFEAVCINLLLRLLNGVVCYVSVRAI